MAFYMRSPVYTPNDPVKSVKQLHSWLYQLNENLKFMFSNLDSDNFTAEFSSRFSEEAARKTQEEMKKLDEAIGKMSEKGEWEALALCGFYSQSDETAPAILNSGACVHVTGEAKLINPLSGNAERILSELSEKHRPRKKQEFLCRAESVYLIAVVRENGEFSILNPSEDAVPENTRVSFSFSYGL